MWNVRTMGQGQDPKVNIVFDKEAGSNLMLSPAEALSLAIQILNSVKDIEAGPS